MFSETAGVNLELLQSPEPRLATVTMTLKATYANP